MSENGEMKKRMEEESMGAERPCTVSESIMQSCKEVKQMREGKAPKRSLNRLFSEIERWGEEDAH